MSVFCSVLCRPGKRSATPDHLLSDPTAVELRPLRAGAGPAGRGGVATPLVSASPPAVSSPGRQSVQSQYTGAGPVYSQNSRQLQPSTTYNPGYQVPLLVYTLQQCSVDCRTPAVT